MVRRLIIVSSILFSCLAFTAASQQGPPVEYGQQVENREFSRRLDKLEEIGNNISRLEERVSALALNQQSIREDIASINTRDWGIIALLLGLALERVFGTFGARSKDRA